MRISSILPENLTFKFSDQEQIRRNIKSMTITAVALGALAFIPMVAAGDKAACIQSCGDSFPPPNPLYVLCVALCAIFG